LPGSTVRAQRKNLYPATALTAQAVLSQVEKATVGRGVRLYVNVSAVSGGTGTDSISLCALPPNSAAGVLIPLIGFSKVGMLSLVAGTYVFDFYPGGSSVLTNNGAAALTTGNLMGAAGVNLPMQWGVQIVLGTGNGATVSVDAEILF
jgi:hypothetical protein